MDSELELRNGGISEAGQLLDASTYLHSSESPGITLVSAQLDGRNYTTWQKAMRIALMAKRKLDFIDGNSRTPAPGTPDFRAWQRADTMVF